MEKEKNLRVQETHASNEGRESNPQNDRGKDTGGKCSTAREDIETRGYGDRKWSDRKRDGSEISDRRGKDLNESSRGRKLKNPAAIMSQLDETFWKWIMVKS